MRHLLLLPFCLLLIPLGSVRGDDAESFELLDGDRGVFIGNTFIERDQVYGYLETMLTARWPDRNITFRNLGWSGDTVWGEARARFGTAADGFKHLKEHVEAIKPTVIFVGFGASESFDGEEGLRKFEEGLNVLLNMLAAAAAPDARIVLLSPIPQASLGPPLPNPYQHNAELKRYSNLIEKMSAERGQRFVNLFRLMESHLQQPWASALTDNGIHLTEHGYGWLWTEARREFGMPDKQKVSVVGKFGDISLETMLNSEVTEFTETPQGYRFEMRHPRLPEPQPRQPKTVMPPKNHPIRIRGLSKEYWVHIDGRAVAASYEIQKNTVTIKIGRHDGPEDRQVDELRRSIIEKNRLYFHRWRPQNETYLFGFRKHEQGQNAAEVPRFDPLIEELEAKIAKLRVPVKHTYELIRRDENGDD